MASTTDKSYEHTHSQHGPAARCGRQRHPAEADRPRADDTVVLDGETLVLTLHEALSPAEKALASSPDGALQVQEYHRQLFQSSADVLRQEIHRITGVAVREAAMEVETTHGVVHAFTNGTMVQVFQLAGCVPADAWNGNRPDGADRTAAGPRGRRRHDAWPPHTTLRFGMVITESAGISPAESSLCWRI